MLSKWIVSGQAKDVHSLEESPIYTEDRLGLKEMNEEGRLIKYSIAAGHVEIPQEDLDYMIDEYVIGNATSTRD